MLVLTRKPGDFFTIKNNETGEEIAIYVLHGRNGSSQQRIGIDAPLSYSIERPEMKNKDRLHAKKKDNL